MQNHNFHVSEPEGRDLFYVRVTDWAPRDLWPDSDLTLSGDRIYISVGMTEESLLALAKAAMDARAKLIEAKSAYYAAAAANAVWQDLQSGLDPDGSFPKL